MDRFTIARGEIDIKSLETMIADLQKQKEEAVMSQDFEKAVQLREKQDQLLDRIKEMKNQDKKQTEIGQYMWADRSGSYSVPPEVYADILKNYQWKSTMGIDTAFDNNDNTSFAMGTGGTAFVMSICYVKWSN